MFSQTLRRDFLVESCPLAISGDVRELFERIRVPNGGQMLHHALSGIEEALTQISDEIPCEPLRRYRNAVIGCLKQMGRSPEFSDDSFIDVDAFPSDPRYRLLLDHSAGDRWEKRTLLNAFLFLLLLERPAEESLTPMVHFIKRPPTLVGLVPPESLIIKLVMVQELIQAGAQQNNAAIQASNILKGLVEQLLSWSPTPEKFTLPPDQRKAILASVAYSHPGGRIDMPSDLLKKLAVSINTRIGSSLRHIHKPLVQTIPEATSVAMYLSGVRRSNKELGDWLAINTVLSTFAGALLGGPASHRINLDGAGDTLALKISAPLLGKTKETTADSRQWANVDHTLRLPLPRAIVKRAEQLLKSPGYDFDSKKKQHHGFLNLWASDEGFPIPLGSAHRVLPAMLGGGEVMDSTLLCLLGLADISRRDAGIYYFSPVIPEIVCRYQHAVASVVTMIDQPEWLGGGWTTLPEQTGCFGASVRPSTDALKDLVGFLRTRAKLSPGKPSLESRIQSFNAEAAYLTVLYLASTGARPVNNVFPPPADWSPASGELMLSEKDSLLYRSTRKLPIVDRLATGVSRFGERQRSLEIQLGRRIDSPQAVFLVGKDGSVLAPTVANLKATIPGFSDFWPWPNDIFRHYFRTRLWELGCSAWVLERAMGHLGKSQTPDAHFSMMPVSETLLSISPYINRLLDELGF